MFTQARGRIYPSINKPIYVQLHEIMVGLIESGELAPGDTLPGERALAEMYDISRVTVRKTLARLVEEGYVSRSQGRETTVAERRISHPLGRLVGSVEEFLDAGGPAAGSPVSIDVVYRGYETGSASVRRHLGLAVPDGGGSEGEGRAASGGSGKAADSAGSTAGLTPASSASRLAPVYAFSRRISRGGQPIALNHSYVPQEIGRLVETLDLATATVFVVLENAGFRLACGEQEISAALSRADEAALLGDRPGQAVLVIRRTTCLDSGEPILYERTVYRADQYQYRIRLQRKL